MSDQPFAVLLGQMESVIPQLRDAAQLAGQLEKQMAAIAADRTPFGEQNDAIAGPAYAQIGPAEHQAAQLLGGLAGFLTGHAGKVGAATKAAGDTDQAATEAAGHGKKG